MTGRERLCSMSRFDLRTTDLLTEREAAAYLGVNTHWMKRARFERDFPHVKLGRLVRYKKADLDAYIAANTHGASA